MKLQHHGLREWIEGFEQLARDPVPPTAPARWAQGAGEMFAASQAHVHVDTGSLKASGLPPRIERDRDEVEAVIEYSADHALYEHARGGDHAFLQRAFVDTAEQFEQAMAESFEDVWR